MSGVGCDGIMNDRNQVVEIVEDDFDDFDMICNDCPMFGTQYCAEECSYNGDD